LTLLQFVEESFGKSLTTDDTLSFTQFFRGKILPSHRFISLLDDGEHFLVESPTKTTKLSTEILLGDYLRRSANKHITDLFFFLINLNTRRGMRSLSFFCSEIHTKSGSIDFDSPWIAFGEPEYINFPVRDNGYYLIGNSIAYEIIGRSCSATMNGADLDISAIQEFPETHPFCAQSLLTNEDLLDLYLAEAQDFTFPGDSNPEHTKFWDRDHLLVDIEADPYAEAVRIMDSKLRPFSEESLNVAFAVGLGLDATTLLPVEPKELSNEETNKIDLVFADVIIAKRLRLYNRRKPKGLSLPNQNPPDLVGFVLSEGSRFGSLPISQPKDPTMVGYSRRVYPSSH